MRKSENIIALKAKTKQGFSLLVIREVCIKFVAFIGQLFLFRFLSPDDFGIFAILAFLINFAGIFTDLGISTAIIQQKKRLDDEELSVTFWITQGLTVLTIFILWFAAPLIFRFYSKLSLVHIAMFRVFLFTLLFRPLRSILIAFFERELNYRTVSLIDVSGILSYQIVVVILAFKGFGVWSFIYAIYAKEILELLIAFVKKPFVPQFYFHVRKIKNLFRFGIYIQFYSLQVFLHDAVSPVIAGKRYGPYSVGILDWSYSIASISKYVTDNYGRISFAAFSRIQEEKKELEKFIDKSCIFLSIFACFFTMIILSLGKDMIHFIFTDKWLPGLTALYIYAIVIMINTIITPLVSAILALGKSKELLYLSFVITAVEWFSAFILVTKIGFIGIPVAALANVLVATIGFLYILRYDRLQFLFFRTLIPKFASTFGIIIFMQFTNTFLPATFPIFLAKGFFVTFLYGLSLYAFSKNDFFEIMYFIKSFPRNFL